MHCFYHVLSLIYPSVCGICGNIHPNSLCKKCEIKLQKELFWRVDSYEKNPNIYFTEHSYIAKYTGVMRQKIIEYKFQQRSYLHEFFSYLFLKDEKMYVLLKKYDIILPVPIHRKRKRQRGYNQSELIARKIAEASNGLKIETKSLIKVKNNMPQSMLNKLERKQNTCGAYNLQHIERIKEKRILLLDDVYTTGSTVNECAKLLRQEGQAKSVGVLTIAKD